MSDRCVYVVDDEEAIRRSMHMMLRVLGYEARTYESGHSFIGAQPEISCGCVLLDLRMPEMDGLEVQRRLAGAGANHSFVIMSGHGDLGVAVAAMEQGALAFLEKPFPRGALEDVLELAFMRLEEPHGYRAHLLSAAAALQKLEAIDQEVLELIRGGHDSQHIAQQMGLPPSMIEFSRTRLYGKLGVQTVAELLGMAYAARRARTP
jgi:two-component system, LuxR family, response regulator FixJ